MTTLSRIATSSLLVLLAVTLTTAADARGGGGGGGHAGGGPIQSNAPAASSGSGHGGANGWNGSNESRGAGHTVHSSTAIVSRHARKILPNGSIALSRRNPHSRKNAALVGRHPVTVPGLNNNAPIVRDHRLLDGSVGNTVGGTCFQGCVGEGGLNVGDGRNNGTMPAQDQSHSTGPGTPQVNDHRTGH